MILDYLQCPLRHRNGNQSRLAKAVFNRTLKRVGPAKLGVDYDELDCPVDGDCKAYKEEYTGEESGLEESVRLTDDAGSTMQWLAMTENIFSTAPTLYYWPYS